MKYSAKLTTITKEKFTPPAPWTEVVKYKRHWQSEDWFFIGVVFGIILSSAVWYLVIHFIY